MQYELVQNALTGLFNSVAIAGISMIILASVNTSLSPQQQLPHAPHIKEPSPSVEQYLQEFQQKLEQAYQEKAQFQTNSNLVKLELKQAQHDLQQIQRELEQVQHDKSQLHSHLAVVQLKLLQAQQEAKQYQNNCDCLQQQLSTTEEHLQQTQQELEKTKQGLLGFVTRLVHLKQTAKEWLNYRFFNKRLPQATQPIAKVLVDSPQNRLPEQIA